MWLEWGKFSRVMAPALDAAGETIMLNDGPPKPATAMLLAASGASTSTGATQSPPLGPAPAPQVLAC